MEHRKELINFFIQKFGYKSYLEIGVKSPTKTFNHIQCENKVGVDPNGCTTYKMTSDKFFEMIDDSTTWDIIFIDGYHEKSQVLKDIYNSLRHLSPNGTIVCHDVNPREEWLLKPEYCWNAWEAFAQLRNEGVGLELHGVTFDHLGFIRKGFQEPWNKTIVPTFQYLDEHRKELMQELTLDELYQKFNITE